MGYCTTTGNNESVRKVTLPLYKYPADNNKICVMLKETPFYKKHLALRAKMVAFAGYNMPVSYTGIKDEHTAVRTNAGVFDVSHMGEFMVKGNNALHLIQSVTTNDASKLKKGEAQYSCLTNANGGIIDDLLVYCIEENNVYMLVVNASNIEKDFNWLAQNNTHNTGLQNISEKTCLLAVQGPNATKIIQPLTETDIMNLKYYTFVRTRFAGIDNVLISATGYTGAGGVEICFEDKDNHAEKIWNAIFELGEAANIQAVGLGARDTLRLEMGYCLYGNDIDDNTSPLEAGLGWITKLNKPENFTAKELLTEEKARGIKKKLIGFEMTGRGIARSHYQVKDKDGNLVGHVTSGTQSPSLDKAIGLAYVDVAHAGLDSEIYIDIRNLPVAAKVVKVPFK